MSSTHAISITTNPKATRIGAVCTIFGNSYCLTNDFAIQGPRTLTNQIEYVYVVTSHYFFEFDWSVSSGTGLMTHPTNTDGTTYVANGLKNALLVDSNFGNDNLY